jgi:hypothetical protein
MTAPVPVTQFGEELENILATAYAFPGGLRDLNRVTEPKLGINTIRDAAGEPSPMADVISALRELIESRGLVHQAIVTFYVALPGNAALRDWVRNNLAPGDQALVPETLFEQERDAYLESRKFGQDQQTAAIGLQELHVSSDRAAIAGILKNSRAMLTAATVKLQLVNFYKKLHDRLHEVQTKPFSRFGGMLLKQELDEADRAEIALHVAAVRDGIPWLHETVAMLKFVDPDFDDRWIARIEAIFNQLDTAEGVTRATLRQAMVGLRSLLSAQLSALNRALIEAARAIPFDRLAELLSAAAEKTSGATRAKLADAAVATEQIGIGLGKTIATHDSWQELDTLLWGFELTYPAAAFDRGQCEDIGAFWRDTIVGFAQGLVGPDAPDWGEIRAAADQFDTALGLDPPAVAALGTAYFFFATAIRQRFYQVDKALLDQCSSLMELRPRLEALTEEPA